MKKTSLTINFLLLGCVFLISANIFAQNDTIIKPKNNFWKKVRFGGGLGLGIGNGYTDISLAPTLYYPIHERINIGLGINGSYTKSNTEYQATIYGASGILTFNPLETVQLSCEIEQLRANVSFDNTLLRSENFWNTALFLGAGYRMQNVTIGMRYNILFQDTNRIYTNAWMPFARVLF